MGLVYRFPNINEEDSTKEQNAIKEVIKGECIIMGKFNLGRIQWKYLESTRGEDQQFIFLIQDSFLNQHGPERTRGENKTTIERWNILKYEIESIIDNFPLKNKENGVEKNTYQKKLLKIVFKQIMRRVYRRTRKDEDFANSNEALNEATTQIKQSE